jgi:hypothetical protein
MVAKRQGANDPRTIARDIPGFFDALFPQLVPGLVANLNRRSVQVPECCAVPLEVVSASSLQRAMLFEVAVAAAEQLIAGSLEIDWDMSLTVALRRQKEHFDAKLPSHLAAADKEASLHVARNLVVMLHYLESMFAGEPLVHAPAIPGYQWIASGVGDFALGGDIVEVKCTSKLFSSADYRQIVMYWLLSYSAAIEGRGREWSGGILVNPRLNRVVKCSFDELIDLISAGRSKVELVETFSTMIESDTYQTRVAGQIIAGKTPSKPPKE